MTWYGVFITLGLATYRNVLTVVGISHRVTRVVSINVTTEYVMGRLVGKAEREKIK